MVREFCTLFLKERSFRLQFSETWISCTYITSRKGLRCKVEPRWSDNGEDDVDCDMWRGTRKRSGSEPRELAETFFWIEWMEKPGEGILKAIYQGQKAHTNLRARVLTQGWWRGFRGSTGTLKLYIYMDLFSEEKFHSRRWETEMDIIKNGFWNIIFF